MKDASVLVFEVIISVIVVLLGLSEKRILFIRGARSATIVLGVIGMLLCTISIGKFISTAPANPLTILGYIFGAISLITFLTQVFKLNTPVISKPKTALIVLAIAMVANSVIGKFYYLIPKK